MNRPNPPSVVALTAALALSLALSPTVAASHNTSEPFCPDAVHADTIEDAVIQGTNCLIGAGLGGIAAILNAALGGVAHFVIAPFLEIFAELAGGLGGGLGDAAEATFSGAAESINASWESSKRQLEGLGIAAPIVQTVVLVLTGAIVVGSIDFAVNSTFDDPLPWFLEEMLEGEEES